MANEWADYTRECVAMGSAFQQVPNSRQTRTVALREVVLKIDGGNGRMLGMVRTDLRFDAAEIEQHQRKGPLDLRGNGCDTVAWAKQAEQGGTARLLVGLSEADPTAHPPLADRYSRASPIIELISRSTVQHLRHWSNPEAEQRDCQQEHRQPIDAEPRERRGTQRG